jgi:hypothetical protein
MKAAMVAKWTTPVPGQEKAAFAYGREVDDFFGKKAAEGLCTEPKWFWAPTGESLCPSQAVTPCPAGFRVPPGADRAWIAGIITPPRAPSPTVRARPRPGSPRAVRRHAPPSLGPVGAAGPDAGTRVRSFHCPTPDGVRLRHAARSSGSAL